MYTIYRSVLGLRRCKYVKDVNIAESQRVLTVGSKREVEA